MKRRRLIASMVVAPIMGARGEIVPAISTSGDQIGDELDSSDFLNPGFSTVFATMPKLRDGPVVQAAPRPLTDATFQWTAGYEFAKPSPISPPFTAGKRQLRPEVAWLPAELATYPNGDAIARGGYSPFSVAEGLLTITADRTPRSMLELIPEGYATDYVSGALISYPFGQRYGYFEMRAKLPRGRGLWPAFWLLPTDRSWPPEVDVMEVLGHDTAALYTTVHTKETGQHRSFTHETRGVDLSLDFHSYGLDWGPERLRFYMDRRLVMSNATPSDYHSPFYVLVNLAVGGSKSWPGAPDAQTSFPARMEIAHIKVWQRKRHASSE
jgi:hypothetical protein